MRITVNLTSTEHENSIWSDNYDLSVEEIFDVQDKIAEEIVATIVGRVDADSLSTLVAKRPENMAAYDLVLQGLEYAKKGNVVKDNIKNAVELFEKAIASEPSYARAHAWRACSLSNLADWEDNPDPNLFTNAIESANLALELEKARELCPSDVFIISRYATMLIYFGEFDKALGELERAMRLDPFSHDLLFGTEALCHYCLANYDKAITSFKKVKVLKAHLFYMALTYLKKGDRETAQEKLKEARAMTGMDIESFIKSEPYKNQDRIKNLKADLDSIKN